MSARSCRLLALIASVGAILAIAPSAGAAVQWNDGTYVTSTMFSCIGGQLETGADAVVGYQADPASLPRAGDVFYAHVGFGAATDVCGVSDQGAEVDLVLPPGVSLAIDTAHPITCVYEDSGQSVTSPNPTCPTHTIAGTYGLQIPSDDAGDPWILPPGRFFLVQFPLRSTRQLKGSAGGYCAASVNEISSYSSNDCLLGALHFLDGSTDPWLVPQEPLYIDPVAAVTPPAGGGTVTPPGGGGTVTPPTAGTVTPPTPGSNKPVTATLSIHQRLRAILRARAILVSCSLSGAGRCKLVISITARQARALHLRVKHRSARYTLGQASKRLTKAGRTTERVILSRKLIAALRKVRKLPVRVQVTITDSSAHSRIVTKDMKLRR